MTNKIDNKNITSLRPQLPSLREMIEDIENCTKNDPLITLGNEMPTKHTISDISKKEEAGKTQVNQPTAGKPSQSSEDYYEQIQAGINSCDEIQEIVQELENKSNLFQDEVKSIVSKK